MRLILLALLLATLAPHSARAQSYPGDGVVHRWALIGEDPDAMAWFHQRLLYFADTANIEAAGPKRQMLVNAQVTAWDTAGVPTTVDHISPVMFDCSTYQVKLFGARWREIDLSPNNVWLKAIKRVCPAEPSR